MAEKSDQTKWGINTQLTHSGNDPKEFHGFVNPPIVHASTVLYPDSATMEGQKQKYTYGTHGTPTTDALASAVNELEGSAGTIILSSGLAAVTVPLLAFLKSGDHLLMLDSVYFPTRRFCDTMLTDLGVEVTYYDPHIGAGIEALIQQNTKVVFTESPGSNTMEIQDIPAIAEIAHKHDAVVMMDNTWATPLFFRPLDFGVDISIQAATKYPGGHADVLMGLVSASKKHWPRLLQAKTNLGMCANPDESYLVLRGLRSMGIRLARHEQSAMEIAKAMQTVDGVADVLHPALPNFPGHDLWKRDFKGSSGLFSFVLDGGGNARDLWRAKAHAFLDALQIFGLGYSWGGYESLAVRVSLKDRTIATEPQAGPVIRLHVGLEDPEDLLADLERGLAAAKRVT
ncbi:MAG: cystathionine beta-lyase [Pseudomonadota bacterium]